MTDEEKKQEVLREKTVIVEQLCRLLDLPSSTRWLWGMAGRLRRNYGTALTVETLSRQWPGRPLKYYTGAVRNEFAKAASYRLPAGVHKA